MHMHEVNLYMIDSLVQTSGLLPSFFYHPAFYDVQTFGEAFLFAFFILRKHRIVNVYMYHGVYER